MTDAGNCQSVIDSTGLEVHEFGIVVRDAIKAAHHYSELFGIGPWTFFDDIPTDLVFQGQPQPRGSCGVRLAYAGLGKHHIVLLQPIYGNSSIKSFLDMRGQGVCYLGLGQVEEYDRIVSSMDGFGINVKMTGNSAGDIPFCQLSTHDHLGTMVDLLKPVSSDVLNQVKPWGKLSKKRARQVTVAGKQIKQVGIVTGDAEAMARNYWEILGIGPWSFYDLKPPYAVGTSLHGVPMKKGVDFHIRAAFAYLGGLEFELLEPVYGPTSHMQFLKTIGPGIHHLSFDVVPDHDEIVGMLTGHGFGIEMSGTIGETSNFTYIASQEKLGTIYEFVKGDLTDIWGIEPYGVYPSAV